LIVEAGVEVMENTDTIIEPLWNDDISLNTTRQRDEFDDATSSRAIIGFALDISG